MEQKLQKIPEIIKTIITLLSEITLEIYVVQYVLIDFIRPHLSFPLNWLAITFSILVAAFILHKICKGIMKVVAWCIEKFKNRQKMSGIK